MIREPLQGGHSAMERHLKVMDEELDAEDRKRPRGCPVEREMDRVARAQLAHRLQYLRAVHTEQVQRYRVQDMLEREEQQLG